MTPSIPFAHSRNPDEAVLVVRTEAGWSLIRPCDPEGMVPVPLAISRLAASPAHAHLLWSEITDGSARWYHGDLKPPVERVFVAPIGGAPRLLIEGICCSAQWAADGRSVWLVTSRRDRDVRSAVRSPLDGAAEVPHGPASDVMPSPAGDLVLLHHPPPARSVIAAVDRPGDVRWAGSVDPIGWSPDGSWFAYHTPARVEPRERFSDPVPSRELWIVAAAGFAAKRAAEDTGRAVWLSDGTLLYTRRQAMAAFPGLFTEAWVRTDPATGVDSVVTVPPVDLLAHPRYPVVATMEFGQLVVWNLDTGARKPVGSARPLCWVDW